MSRRPLLRVERNETPRSRVALAGEPEPRNRVALSGESEARKRITQHLGAEEGLGESSLYFRLDGGIYRRPGGTFVYKRPSQ